jgi:hypothetical protein
MTSSIDDPIGTDGTPIKPSAKALPEYPPTKKTAAHCPNLLLFK